MRLGLFVSLAFVLMLGLWSTPSMATPVSGSQAMSITALQQQPSGGSAEPAQPGSGAQQAQPSGKVDIDINVNRGQSSGRWYANPMWIAIGGLAVIVLIALIVMAGRGGGTTVVKG
jgi:hypothetical protein